MRIAPQYVEAHLAGPSGFGTKRRTGRRHQATFAGHSQRETGWNNCIAMSKEDESRAKLETRGCAYCGGGGCFGYWGKKGIG